MHIGIVCYPTFGGKAGRWAGTGGNGEGGGGGGDRRRRHEACEQGHLAGRDPSDRPARPGPSGRVVADDCRDGGVRAGGRRDGDGDGRGGLRIGGGGGGVSRDDDLPDDTLRRPAGGDGGGDYAMAG